MSEPATYAAAAQRALALGRLQRPSLHRRRNRLLAAVAIVAILLLVGWLWLRSSSLVAVREVSVSGLSGPQVGEIRAALTESAKTMTTLNASVAKLEAAVASFGYVHSLQITTHGAHGLSIAVDEQVPVAELVVGGRPVVVDSDGELLSGAASSALPALSPTSAPAGALVTDQDQIAEVKLLAAAPYALIAHIQSVSVSSSHGLVAQLRNGPAVYFGAADAPAASWQALVAVLASSTSQGASYVDVSNPNRPAAG